MLARFIFVFVLFVFLFFSFFLVQTIDQPPQSLLLVCISPYIFQACVYMLFSIIAAALGGIIAIIYSVEIYFITSYGLQNSHNYHAKLAIIVIMLILGIATFWLGIWAAVCTCLLKPCSRHLRVS